MYELKCYFKLVDTYIKSLFISRFSLLFYIFGLLFMHASTFLGIWVIFDKFKMISGWSFEEVIFIYILTHISYGLRTMFFNSFRLLSNLIKKGDLDQVLIRPVNPFVYIMGSRFELAALSSIGLGIILFMIFKDRFPIYWSISNIIFYVIAIISATLVQAAITIAISAMSFYFVNVNSIESIYNSFREFIWYPVSLYNEFIQFILFFIIPLAFASYAPAGIFLNNSSYNIYPKYVWKLSLLVGFLIFLLAYIFWTHSLKKYQSTGS